MVCLGYKFKNLQDFEAIVSELIVRQSVLIRTDSALDVGTITIVYR